MSDLINRQEAIDKFKPWLKVEGYSEGERNMLKAVLLELQEFPAEKGCPYWDAESKYCSLHRPPAQKTVGNVLESLENDAVPVRHGKWLEKRTCSGERPIGEWQSCKCSVCGRYDNRPYLYYFVEPNFCSWCGAEMKGEAK